MEIINKLLENLISLVPTAVTALLVLIVLFGLKFVLNKRYSGIPGRQFRLQLIMLLLSFISLLIVILTLPIKDSTLGQLLSLLGILLSAAIALSSTTIIGNVMAGLMLRVVKNFRPGDFIRVEEHFGRVSERGLFHVEIQTEDRDLTTIPNIFLAGHPVKVIRTTGTLISAEVSLGYDVSDELIKENLKKAAIEAGLDDPFVMVMELGDFSVTYRVAGILTEVKSLLTTRSKLRECMLHHLHRADIEIVSPTFMNQRQLSPDKKVLSKPKPVSKETQPKDAAPEAILFDKADEAESLERLKERRDFLDTDLKKLKDELEKAVYDKEKEEITNNIEQTKARMVRLAAYIDERMNEKKE